MDAMAGITDAAAVVDVVITTDAAAGIPSAKASARDTGRDTMMHCGTAAAVAVTMMAAVADAAMTVMAAVADAVAAATSTSFRNNCTNHVGSRFECAGLKRQRSGLR